jgi:hypothetical protein
VSGTCTAASGQAIATISQTPATAGETDLLHASQSAARRVARSALASYAVFLILAGLYLLPFMRIMLPHTNEGTLIYGAERILNGEVFARDFFEVMGPGTFYIVALVLKLFGHSFFATRIWLCGSSLGIAFCMYFLARRVCVRHPLLPCLIVAGASFGMQWPAISHHLDSNLFALVSVVCLVIWEERRQSLLLYAAGMCAGITTWIHQPKGVLLLLAILLWFLMSKVSGAGRGASCERVLFGFAVVGLSGGAYFLKEGALASLYYANVTWPAHNYGTVNKVPYALGIFSEYWRHWAASQGTLSGWSIALATVLIIPFLFVAIVPAVFLLLIPRLRTRPLAPSILLCVLCGWAMWFSEIHRADIYHLVFGSPLLLLVGVGLLSDLKSWLARWTLQLLAISACCLMTINLLQAVTVHSVTTRAGTVGMLRPDPVMQFVNATIPPGEEVFFYPYCPMYYFLTETRNPTRFSILVYNYNTPAEFHEVVRVLEQQRIKYVIWDASFEDLTFKAVFPGVSPIPAKTRIIEPYLQSRYKQIANFDGYRILARNE